MPKSSKKHSSDTDMTFDPRIFTGSSDGSGNPSSTSGRFIPTAELLAMEPEELRKMFNVEPLLAAIRRGALAQMAAEAEVQARDEQDSTS